MPRYQHRQERPLLSKKSRKFPPLLRLLCLMINGEDKGTLCLNIWKLKVQGSLVKKIRVQRYYPMDGIRISFGGRLATLKSSHGYNWSCITQSCFLSGESWLEILLKENRPCSRYTRIARKRSRPNLKCLGSAHTHMESAHPFLRHIMHVSTLISCLLQLHHFTLEINT